MCRPDGALNIVIAGAGPAGLLLTALLLQLNSESQTPRYKITLVDNRQDFGLVKKEEMKNRFRSWMLGLASHGIVALKEVDGLYEEYCKDVGVPLEGLSIHLGAKEIASNASDDDLGENFIIDRNFIVAAIARFVHDVSQDREAEYTALYETSIMYVDYNNRRVLIRGTSGEGYLNYDLLVGCDGARSVVREALVKRHSTFEMDVGDIFQTFKQTHIDRPKGVSPASMHLLPNGLPSMSGIALPETGDKLNVSFGVPRHMFETDDMPKELKSNDPKVVADFVKKNFKAFEMADYDDFAQQWTSQKWNRTAQVHCNYYHSTDINVVIMGDAAHATSPSIGMGMNQALKDAQTFYLLLKEHDDDLKVVLPSFSEIRVKEGNSLTDLAMHLYCLDTKHQLIETLHMVVRSALHGWFPSIIAQHPQNMIGRVEFSLSDVYQAAMDLGIIRKHRRINADIRQKLFEDTTGMVRKNKKSLSLSQQFVIGGAVVTMGAIAVAFVSSS